MKLYDELVWRGLIKDMSSPELEQKLNEGGMTFYIGTDPTGDSLHLGHLSSFLITKRLKDAGHHPILLIGGATGLIGDPRPTAERSIISKETVDKNVLGLTNQVKELFGFDIVNNYDWSKDINFLDYLRDYGKYFNINYMLDKDIIKRRLDSGITYTEFSYMIMQSLDFLWLFENKNCVMQVAGSDQWGNITAGIDLIRKKTGKEAYGFVMPLVTTKDGTKFGKSEGNALWLDKNKTSSYEMYQYLINSDDEMVIDYLKIFTFLSKEEIEKLEQSLKTNPELREAQKALAKEVITFIHSEEDYLEAKKISESLFSEDIFNLTAEEIINNLNIPTVKLEIDKNIVDLLVETNICSSKREARELVSSNAISVNNKKVTLEDVITKDNLIDNKVALIKKGKKKYYLGIYE